MQAIDSAPPSPLRSLAPVIALVPLAMLVAIGTALVGPFVVLPIFGLLFFALVLAHPEYGIAMFLSTFLITYPAALQGSGFLTINNVMGGIFVILLAYKTYADPEWWFLRVPELYLLLLVILMFYLSGRINGPEPRLLALIGPNQAPPETLRTLVARSVFVLFFIVYIRKPRHVRLIYVLATGFMVASSITGIQNVLKGGLAGYRTGFRARSLVIGAAINPNRVALFAILALAALWYFRRNLRRPVLRLLVFPLLVVLAWAVFMCGSRSGLLGLVVCGVAIIIDEGFSLTQLLNMILGGLLLAVLVVGFVPERTLDRAFNLPFTQGGQTGEGSTSLQNRQYLMQVAFDMFSESAPFGIGIGNWELMRFLKDPTRRTGAPHSSYLLALVEGGLFCLMGYLLLLWRTWTNLRFVERHVTDPDSPLADLAWVVTSSKISLIVLVFMSLFADLWQLVTLYWLIGLGVVMRRMVEQSLSGGALPA